MVYTNFISAKLETWCYHIIWISQVQLRKKCLLYWWPKLKKHAISQLQQANSWNKYWFIRALFSCKNNKNVWYPWTLFLKLSPTFFHFSLINSLLVSMSYSLELQTVATLIWADFTFILQDKIGILSYENRFPRGSFSEDHPLAIKDRFSRKNGITFQPQYRFLIMWCHWIGPTWKTCLIM